MSTRFSVQEVPVLGGWRVHDTHLGRMQPFGTDRIGALDYADHQNHAADMAGEVRVRRLLTDRNTMTNTSNHYATERCPGCVKMGVYEIEDAIDPYDLGTLEYLAAAGVSPELVDRVRRMALDSARRKLALEGQEARS
jgi:hypothetical protein